MYLTDVSIRRPALSWVLSLILVVFGTFVFSKLPVRELPSGLQPPVVQVQVKYASASAPIVDEEVTQVIEEVIGGAEGIKNIDAKSENGKSTINIEFDTDIDLDNAANDVRERVARVVFSWSWWFFRTGCLRGCSGFDRFSYECQSAFGTPVSSSRWWVENDPRPFRPF